MKLHFVCCYHQMQFFETSSTTETQTPCVLVLFYEDDESSGTQLLQVI